MYHKFLSHEHIITYNTTQRNKHKQSEKGGGGKEAERGGRKSTLVLTYQPQASNVHSMAPRD